MKDFFSRILQNLKYPRLRYLIPTYVLTAIFCVCAIVLACLPLRGFLAVLAYVLFGVAGVTLAYSVYTLVRFAPAVQSAVVHTLMKSKTCAKWLQNYDFKTVVFATLSLILNISYGIFHGCMGIYYRSVWNGALASYYIFLCVIRGELLLHRNVAEKEKQVQTYKNSGIFLLVLNVAISAGTAQMIFDDRSFTYAGWTVYAFAVYAFWKITTASIHFFRAKKNEHLIVEAIRNINLVDACVSILALQTGLLSAFGDGIDASPYNTLTGSAVTLITVGVAIYMLIKAKQMKERSNEE